MWPNLHKKSALQNLVFASICTEIFCYLQRISPEGFLLCLVTMLIANGFRTVRCTKNILLGLSTHSKYLIAEIPFSRPAAATVGRHL